MTAVGTLLLVAAAVAAAAAVAVRGAPSGGACSKNGRSGICAPVSQCDDVTIAGAGCAGDYRHRCCVPRTESRADKLRWKATETRRSDVRGSQNGLTYMPSSRAVAKWGNPCAKTPQCRGITGSRIKNLIIRDTVGPFRVTGQRLAVYSLKRVFIRIKHYLPDLFPRMGTAGMACCRCIRSGSSCRGSFSNHAFGGAIDLTVDGVLDSYGNGHHQHGLLAIWKHFADEGWYWGAGFSTEDAMHFEVARQTWDRWSSNPPTDPGAVATAVFGGLPGDVLPTSAVTTTTTTTPMPTTASTTTTATTTTGTGSDPSSSSSSTTTTATPTTTATTTTTTATTTTTPGTTTTTPGPTDGFTYCVVRSKSGGYCMSEAACTSGDFYFFGDGGRGCAFADQGGAEVCCVAPPETAPPLPEADKECKPAVANQKVGSPCCVGKGPGQEGYCDYVSRCTGSSVSAKWRGVRQAWGCEKILSNSVKCCVPSGSVPFRIDEGDAAGGEEEALVEELAALANAGDTGGDGTDPDRTTMIAAIVGSAVGAVIIMAACAVAACMCVSRRRRRAGGVDDQVLYGNAGAGAAAGRNAFGSHRSGSASRRSHQPSGSHRAHRVATNGGSSRSHGRSRSGTDQGASARGSYTPMAI